MFSSYSVTDSDLTKSVSLFLPRDKATSFWYTVICAEYHMADKVRERSNSDFHSVQYKCIHIWYQHSMFRNYVMYTDEMGSIYIDSFDKHAI
jgi:hypothetical protein